MITLYEQDIRWTEYQSSKGNQLKWIKDGIWYKADYTGYEGLSEYMVSYLLKESSLTMDEYVIYNTEEIQYGSRIFRGCRSSNFLKEGEQLITLERLFDSFYGESLYKSIYKIQNLENRIRFLVDQTESMTGLDRFGEYLCKLLTIDAFFMNEDRHTHNIAVIKDERGEYRYCPVFDNGAALLSDLILDYPMGRNVLGLMETVRAKTICGSFEEQLEVAERIYGDHLRFTFGKKSIQRLLEKEQVYSVDVKNRVEEILLQQMRKYQYLFL